MIKMLLLILSLAFFYYCGSSNTEIIKPNESISVNWDTLISTEFSFVLIEFLDSENEVSQFKEYSFSALPNAIEYPGNDFNFQVRFTFLDHNGKTLLVKYLESIEPDFLLPTLNRPSLNPLNFTGSFVDSLGIVIEYDSSVSYVHYSFQDTMPTMANNRYSYGDTLWVNSSIKLNAQAFAKNISTHQLKSEVTYQLFVKQGQQKLLKPILKSLTEGEFENSVKVVIENFDNNISQVYYTTNGAEPTVSSMLYTDTLLFTQTTTVKAKSFPLNDKFSVSNLTELKVKKQGISQLPIPVIESSVFGVFTQSTQITINDFDATTTQIFYTIDGSDPSESSLIYNGSFSISQTTTIKAKSFPLNNINGFSVSNVVEFQVIKLIPQKLATPYIYQDFEKLDSIRLVIVFDDAISKFNWMILDSTNSTNNGVTTQTLYSSPAKITWNNPNTKFTYQLRTKDVNRFVNSDTDTFEIKKLKPKQHTVRSNNFYSTAILCQTNQESGFIKLDLVKSNLTSDNSSSISCQDSLLVFITNTNNTYYYRLFFEDHQPFQASDIDSVVITNVRLPISVQFEDQHSPRALNDSVYEVNNVINNRVFVNIPHDSIKLEYKITGINNNFSEYSRDSGLILNDIDSILNIDFVYSMYRRNDSLRFTFLDRHLLVTTDSLVSMFEITLKRKIEPFNLTINSVEFIQNSNVDFAISFTLNRVLPNDLLIRNKVGLYELVNGNLYKHNYYSDYILTTGNKNGQSVITVPSESYTNTLDFYKFIIHNTVIVISRNGVVPSNSYQQIYP